ncbi:MAGE family protein [Rutstroemia sp. NJR-2017a BBW]|nr:MAGE family protein [Rutstroemia sp. NJR-2017a BBW]
MPSVARRGRQVQQIREDKESEEESSHNTQSRRRALSENSEEDGEEENEGIDGSEEDSQDQVVKKLVRYALACEFQRLPITRTGIKEKADVKAAAMADKTSPWSAETTI